MRKSVLVIDDDAAMLRAVSKVLSREGYSVMGAANLDAAIDQLTKWRQAVDLVITDLRMPPFSGIGALDVVQMALPHVPVIVITAFGSPETKTEALRRGACAFLEKPLDTAQLVDAIEHALSARPG
jgi:DNA-binding NtrC family response regulator